ncbi:hypothetical protein CEXT_652981 [Caerostris extrusa]|uniref:Uncharacterized protein n=1 Tax=Caerostris extrusa TaxID=172846 RepID=A0AAV4T5D6_CAEEX|nr:hypothetical protein CEXT_652981 [Caerostris extrusa]
MCFRNIHLQLKNGLKLEIEYIGVSSWLFNSNLKISIIRMSLVFAILLPTSAFSSVEASVDKNVEIQSVYVNILSLS